MKDQSDTIFTLEKIYTAYRACQKGKRNTVNALKFEYNREKNLFDLREDLQNRTYTISRHIYFIVTHPTPREIFAADFRDRIVHHLLCQEIQELFERDFIDRSYANRVGKGTHRAVRQLQLDLQCVRRQYPVGKYYLKLDIENFFRSIDHNILYKIILKKLDQLPPTASGFGSPAWRAEILWLLQLIIFQRPTTNYVYRGSLEKKKLIPLHKSLFTGNKNAGLPIGNLTSQFFANVYLNELDKFVTETLGQKTYLRYVDDFVIVGTNRQLLLGLCPAINIFLYRRLALRVHPRKTILALADKGVNFLGYIVRPNYILVRQSVVKRLNCQLRSYARRLANQRQVSQASREVEERKLMSRVASYRGHFSHANSHYLQARKLALANSLVLGN